MQALNNYHWAQDKIEEVITGKKHREEQACERRLLQMQAKRDKDEKRKQSGLAKATE